MLPNELEVAGCSKPMAAIRFGAAGCQKSMLDNVPKQPAARNRCSSSFRGIQLLISMLAIVSGQLAARNCSSSFSTNSGSHGRLSSNSAFYAGDKVVARGGDRSVKFPNRLVECREPLRPGRRSRRTVRRGLHAPIAQAMDQGAARYQAQKPLGSDRQTRRCQSCRGRASRQAERLALAGEQRRATTRTRRRP